MSKAQQRLAALERLRSKAPVAEEVDSLEGIIDRLNKALAVTPEDKHDAIQKAINALKGEE